MYSKAKKIGLLSITVIILAAIIYIYNELNSLSGYEQLVENVYSSQLETILFSVNQYSEDAVNNRFRKIEKIEWGGDLEIYDKFLRDYPEIHSIIIKDPDQNAARVYSLKDEADGTLVENILKANEGKISRLFDYAQETGFRKIEPFSIDSAGKKVVWISLISWAITGYKVCALVVDVPEFTRQIILQKIRSIEEEKYKGKFKIVIANDRTEKNVYSNYPSSPKKSQFSKKLWLLPGYSIGIALTGRTFESLIRERVYANFILIALIFIALGIGLWLIYRNFRKEIELAQAKTEFAANVSHELRTPLALITMFAETLEMGRVKSEERKKEYYTIISQETNRLSRIVNKILNFSKMEAGKRTFSFDYVNLNEVAEDIYNNYKFHIENKGFKFKLILDEEIPFVKLDKESVSESIINLLDNAVKYSQDVKDITIRTGFEGNSVFVSVEDKGVGISEENMKKVFDKFFRVSSHLIHNTKGTGLGLTIVKQIMDAHNGSIILNSNLWEGSSFKLIFPSDFIPENNSGV